MKTPIAAVINSASAQRPDGQHREGLGATVRALQGEREQQQRRLRLLQVGLASSTCASSSNRVPAPDYARAIVCRALLHNCLAESAVSEEYGRRLTLSAKVLISNLPELHTGNSSDGAMTCTDGADPTGHGRPIIAQLLKERQTAHIKQFAVMRITMQRGRVTRHNTQRKLRDTSRWLRLHDGALAQREQLASIAANDAVISFLRKSLARDKLQQTWALIMDTEKLQQGMSSRLSEICRRNLAGLRDLRHAASTLQHNLQCHVSPLANRLADGVADSSFLRSLLERSSASRHYCLPKSASQFLLTRVESLPSMLEDKLAACPGPCKQQLDEDAEDLRATQEAVESAQTCLARLDSYIRDAVHEGVQLTGGLSLGQHR
ncbi:hypothetical protein WJX84_004851 [Apatococcus fuscideae]|uniref:Uncharacterized protein n=1 Tax=Apatococcus fuscideae TaxID=2026836 RepID=A0AAW1TL89_9CHLO